MKKCLFTVYSEAELHCASVEFNYNTKKLYDRNVFVITLVKSFSSNNANNRKQPK